MYEFFRDADACLVIRDRTEFSKRLYAATDRVLSNYGGVDASVGYGILRHEYGAPFMKPDRYSFQFEWRYVWLPIHPVSSLEPFFVTIGNIEDIAHIQSPG